MSSVVYFALGAVWGVTITGYWAFDRYLKRADILGDGLRLQASRAIRLKKFVGDMDAISIAELHTHGHEFEVQVRFVK